MKKEKIRELLINEYPIKILSHICKCNMRNHAPTIKEISDKTDCQYQHTVTLISRMIELGILKKHKDGRNKHIRITENSVELAKGCMAIDDAVNNHIENMIEP